MASSSCRLSNRPRDVFFDLLTAGLYVGPLGLFTFNGGWNLNQDSDNALAFKKDSTWRAALGADGQLFLTPQAGLTLGPFTLKNEPGNNWIGIFHEVRLAAVMRCGHSNASQLWQPFASWQRLAQCAFLLLRWRVTQLSCRSLLFTGCRAFRLITAPLSQRMVVSAMPC